MKGSGQTVCLNFIAQAQTHCTFSTWLRDLHPGNVLLDDEGHVLLTYFGLWEETAHVPAETAIDHLYCAPGKSNTFIYRRSHISATEGIYEFRLPKFGVFDL